MKTNLFKNTIIASFITATFIVGGCKDFVEGVGEFDPTLPRDASLGQVINAAEVGLIGFVEGDLARLAGIFTGQFSGADRQYVSLNNYVVTALDFDSQWGNIYANVFKATRIAQTKANELNNSRALGLAKILEAYTIGMAAALFGDIPYSEANNFGEFSNPAYDPQRQVYASVISVLDDAISNIQNAAPGTGYVGDLFGGDDATWIARANTLKARFYLHLGDYTNARAAALNGITDSVGDMIAQHGTSYLQNFNIYYSFLVYDRPGYMAANGSFAPLILDPGSDDPNNRNNAKTNETSRYDFYYFDYGIYASGYEPNFFSVDDWGEPNGYFGADSPWTLLSYRENQLILAETELRLNGLQNGLDALNAYREYLDEGGYWNPEYSSPSALYAPLAAADFAPGGIENADNIAAAEALYREIIEEKYISLLGHLEVFNDLRRPGYGAFAQQQNWEVLGITPNTGTTIPQRFLVPQTELNSNTSAPSPPPGLFERTEVFGG